MVVTAHQVNIVVILVKVLLANVLDLVLENRVKIILIADINLGQFVVILVEVEAFVLDLVLENHVNGMTTVDQENIAVVQLIIEHVPRSIVLENFVPLIAAAHWVNIVVIVVKVVYLVNVLGRVLENHVKIITPVDQVNIVVVQLIKHVP
jgi:hypothetical protein